MGVFRIVQEAVRKVVRHSGANRAWIDVTADDRRLQVLVGDDGPGFDIDATAVRGLGLAGMRKRGARLGGSATITSAPAAGTIVQVRVPQAEPRHWQPTPPEARRRLGPAMEAGDGAAPGRRPIAPNQELGDRCRA